MSRVEIVIDELVIRGIDPWQARTAAAAIEARLGRLAAEGGGGELPERAESSRRLPAIEAPSGSPAALGDAVAGAVWGALSPGEDR